MKLACPHTKALKHGICSIAGVRYRRESKDVIPVEQNGFAYILDYRTPYVRWPIGT